MGIRAKRRRQNSRILGITLKGREGKPYRIALYCAAAAAALLAAILFLRPKNQLMNTAEMKRIVDRGVLVVGVRDDTPGFSLNGEGLEIELAERFAVYLLPNTEAGSAAKLVTVSGQTAATKLQDGTIDIAIAMMQKGASSKYSYSYAYFTDTCIVAVRAGNESKPLEEMMIGCVQNTAGANVLKNYIDEHETKVRRTLLDRIRGVTPELPANAVTYTKQNFASYPDMLIALSEGRIDGAVLTGVYAKRYGGEFTFSVHKTVLGKVEYAITASADEPAIAQLADVFLYELRKSGELDELLEKYGLSELNNP